MNESSAFRLEKELVAALRDSSPAILDASADVCHVLEQPQIGRRIPDLLLIFAGSDQQRSPLRLTYFDCMILATILEKAMGPMDLAERTYSPTLEITSRVERLARIGLVSKRNDGTIEVPRAALPDVRIVAVEAKLFRWREALLQAEAYFSFANECFIAMPSETVRHNLPALDACANVGVGVIAVDQDGGSVLLESQQRQPRTADWLRLVSSAVGLNQTRAVTRANASRHAR